MNLEEAIQYAIRISGRKKELVDQFQEILNRGEQIKAIIDEPLGVEKAEIALKQDESFYESNIKPKVQMWDLQLTKKSHEGKADIAEERIKIIQSKKEIEENESEESKIADAEGEKLIRDFNQSLDQAYSAMGSSLDVVEYAQDIYQNSVKPLRDQIQRSLEEYKRHKVIALAIPKTVYLFTTLFVFGLGASMLGDKIPVEEFYLKLGFAVAIWAVQEFLFAPQLENWSLRFRRQKLKILTQLFSEIRARGLAIDTVLDSQLKR